MRGVLELTRMRLLLMWRQPEVVFWTFVFPILLTVVLGLAFRERGPEPIPVAVLDGERAAEVLELLTTDAGLRAELVDDADEATRLLRSAAVDLVVHTGADLELAFDASRPEAVAARLRVADALQRGAGRADVLVLVERPVTERGSRYVDWFVPGMLGFSIMSTSIWGVGFAFVEVRQKRLLKRLLATPMSRLAYLLAPILARMLLLVPEAGLLIVFARWVLDMPLVGSVTALALLTVCGALAFAGIGVLLGSRNRTPEAAAGLANLAIVPMMLASGVFFSYERFAPALHPWIRALPLTALNDGLRAIALEGVALAALGSELLVLGLWGAGGLLLGLAIFRWE